MGGKIYVSVVFLDAEFKYVSRISLSPTPFAPGLEAWSLLRQDTEVCFYRGRHEEFKEYLLPGIWFSVLQ